jgi:hypothetical protein
MMMEMENIILAQPWGKDPGSFHIDKEHATVQAVKKLMQEKMV